MKLDVILIFTVIRSFSLVSSPLNDIFLCGYFSTLSILCADNRLILIKMHETKTSNICTCVGEISSRRHTRHRSLSSGLQDDLSLTPDLASTINTDFKSLPRHTHIQDTSHTSQAGFDFKKLFEGWLGINFYD